MTGRVGEGLYHHHRVAPASLEVLRESLQREGERLKGEVLAAVLVKDAEPPVVGDVAQPLIALGIAPRHQLLTTAHAQRSEPETNKRTPLAVFFSDVAHHLADEASAEPMLTLKRLVEANSLSWKDRSNQQRWRRHPRVCSGAGRVSGVPPRQFRPATHTLTLPRLCSSTRRYQGNG